MPIVQIEGVGRVQFPDGMSSEDMTRAIETEILPQQQARSDTSAGRQVALAGRAAAEGVATAGTSAADLMMNSPISQVLAPANPVSAIGAGVQATTGHTPVHWAVKAFNKISGMNIPETDSFQGLLEAALTEAGAPIPQTSSEKLASAAVKGTTAGLAGAGAAGIGGAANALRAAISGASGGTSAEVAKQAGAGPIGQAAAGLAGGLAPAALEGAGRLAAQTVRGIARPLTRSGQEQMAAQIMQDNATDAPTAASNLDRAAQIVPGSQRTTGEASRDVGLLALEKGVRGRNTAAFGERLSEQNAARQTELGAVAGTPADMAAARAARDAATGPMRDTALASGQAADITPVTARIDTLLASPAGRRQTVSATLNWARELIGDETNPAALYEIRKDLQLAQQGRLQPSSANAPNASTLAQARGQLGEVVQALDDSIEASAPGFRAYLERYRELSRPIDQMRVMQEIQRRAQLTTADVTTQQNFIGAASYSRALDSALQRNGNRLTAEQIQRLQAIRTDLQYGQAINSALIKAPGSDTFQNLSIAQVIGAGPTGPHPIFGALAKPLNWLYRAAGSDERVSEILAQAMLDPNLGAQMLRRATPSTMAEFSRQLRQLTGTSVLASAPGVASQKQSESAEAATP